jgi:HNH endonuclease
MLTQERLKQLVSYDSETGIFMRIARTTSFKKMKEPMGSIDSHGYLWASVDSKIYRLHRLAVLYVTGVMPDKSIDVDHRNLVRTDNCFRNLRCVSRSVNMQNKRMPSSNNKTGFLGVFLHKQLQRYTAQIRVNGKNRHLGMFDTPELAHQAYIAAKRQFHEGNTL